MKLLLILIIIFCSLCLVEAQSNPHYTVTDPAIKEMLISMDMPRYTGNVPAENIVGAWQLILSDGTYIDLALLQSSSVIFGKGKITTGANSQSASASGSVSGNSLQLQIVPESGEKLYAVSVDIGHLPFVGTYVTFGADSAANSGTLQANKINTLSSPFIKA